MLYRPEAFEPLTEAPWIEGQVRDAIATLVADAETAFDSQALWPADEWDAWTSPTPLKNLYVGAAGVVWSLGALARRGHAGSRLDLGEAARAVLHGWREQRDYPAGIELPEPADASLLGGESGILTVGWQLTRDASLGDDLHARVLENAPNDANELMWGSPGTMLAARAMQGWTGDERWGDAWRASAEELWRRRTPDGLWTQHLYGESARSLGVPHGLLGNVAALLGGGELLDAARRDALRRETADVLARNAVVEDGLANWPLGDGRDLAASDGEIKVQWCGGAPGVVIAAASYLDDELLLAGAELTWRAGPPGLEKGAGICHGTAGNGYAFLKAFERTGDERWLDRARRFAVHALEQVERKRAERGRGRYSLWTGDLGTALYAADCLDARTAYPIVDSWD